MDVVFSPELTICGIEELPGQSARNVTHVLSLLDPDLPERVRPRPDHVASILAFGQDFLNRQDRDAASHLLVHCHMGISRSTAAMLTLMAQGNPDEEAENLFTRLTVIRPQAWPNSQMVGFADEQLGRNGDLTAALRRHYGRQIRKQPQYLEWMTKLGRKAELDMAILD